MAGITNNVKTKEKIVPNNYNSHSNSTRRSSPKRHCIGKAPNEMAKLVIRIGRIAPEASKIASSLGLPCSRN
jgi:hypothetical protein